MTDPVAPVPRPDRLPAEGNAIRLSPTARLDWYASETARNLPATVRRLDLPGGPGLHLALGSGSESHHPPRLVFDLEAGAEPEAAGLRLLLRLDAPEPQRVLRCLIRPYHGGEPAATPPPDRWLTLRTGLWQEVVTPAFPLSPGDLDRLRIVFLLGRDLDVVLAEATALRRPAPDGMRPPEAPAPMVRPVADLAARRAGPPVGAAELTATQAGPEGHVLTAAPDLAWRAEGTGRTGRVAVAADGRVAGGIAPPLPPGEVLALLGPDGAPLWTGRVPAPGDAPGPALSVDLTRRAEFRLTVAGHAAAAHAPVALLVGDRVAASGTAAAKAGRTDLPDPGGGFRLEAVLPPAEARAPVALQAGDGPPVPILVQGPGTPPPALPPAPPPPEGATARGEVSRATASGIAGRAICPEAPDAPVTLRLTRDGAVLAETRTKGRARGGLDKAARAAALAFRFDLPPGIAAQGARLTLVTDPPGALEGAEIVLPPPPGLTGAAPPPLSSLPEPQGPGPADTILLEPPGRHLSEGLRRRLASHLADPGLGAVGTGGIWLAPDPVPVWHEGDAALPCAALTGAVLMRRADWEALGGLDPALPGALARAELCLWLREAGRGLACLPEGPAPGEAAIGAEEFRRHLGARARRLLRADAEGALTGTRPRVALLASPEAAGMLAPALAEALPCHLRLPPDADLAATDIALVADPALDPRRIAGAEPGLTLLGWGADAPDTPLALACDRLVDSVPAVARRPPPPLRIAIANSARRANRAEWGDAHFADSLAAAVRRLGHVARVDDRDDWQGAAHGLAQADDAVIALRGLHPYTPRRGQVSVMWLISHPDAVSPAEIAAFDHACIASAPHAAILEQLLPGRLSVLPQCTDTTRFAFDPGRAADGPPLYVANSRKVFRDPVRWALAHDLPLEIHGRGWEALAEDPRLQDRLIPNEVLGQLYGAARWVVCDHWADMARLGYVSNRVFDVLAAGGRLLVDEVAGLEDLVPARFFTRYTSEAEFVAALSAPPPPAHGLRGNPGAHGSRENPAAPDLRAEAAAWAATHHSFDARAATLVARIEALLRPGRGDLPSPPDSRKGDTILPADQTP
ncbi:glycosyltransferase family protein [Jannaschia formosa]|uniref:glycosyltransferase family protein n=1 Tax=Jannaschia formosa TaxID=2259592 RepID=UPI000E1BCB08|nr:hypothetical protein [Jannaschia formosa]TFL17115.1 hypothetical protein DR046_16380 [Jannaschia formosa]